MMTSRFIGHYYHKKFMTRKILKLLAEVVTLWVTIRGFSLAASWMEAYKKHKHKTTQKATGLRKPISGTS